MKKIAFALFALLSFNLALAQTMTVVDEENYPLPAACVFDNNGAMLGITNDNGEFDLTLVQFYPLTIKTAGMSDAVVEKPQEKVVMKFRLIELPEISFTPKDRPVMHIVAYARETMSCIIDKDTMIVQSEYMGDYFIATQKCKFKSVLKPRQRNKRTTIIRKMERDMLGMDTIAQQHSFNINLPKEDIVEHKNLVGDKTGVERKMGKNGYVEKLYKKTPVSYMEFEDPLASDKDHKFSLGILKLIGIDLAINRIDKTLVFENNKAAKHSVQDMLYMTVNSEIVLGGKRVNKELKANDGMTFKIYEELFPVKRAYLTEEEAQAELMNNSPLDFEIPEAAK